MFEFIKETGVVESHDKDSELQKANKGASSTIFTEALISINVGRWPAFSAGSAAASEMPDLSGKLSTPFSNL